LKSSWKKIPVRSCSCVQGWLSPTDFEPTWSSRKSEKPKPLNVPPYVKMPSRPLLPA